MALELPNWLSDPAVDLAPFAKIRLVALDIDGTLIGSEAESVFEKIRSLHRQLQSQVALTIATGRTFTGASEHLRKLPISRSTPIVLYNGAVVLSLDGVIAIEHGCLPINTLPNVLNSVPQGSASVYAYYSGIGVFGARETVFGWSNTHSPSRETNGLSVQWQSEWISNTDLPPTTIIVTDSCRTTLQQVRLSFGSCVGLSVTSSGGPYLEFRATGYDKGSALSVVASRLALSPSEILALGDNDNDAEMLQWAGIGVAVSRASQLACLSANFVCHHGAAGAVVEVLRLIKHAKRFHSR